MSDRDRVDEAKRAAAKERRAAGLPPAAPAAVIDPAAARAAVEQRLRDRLAAHDIDGALAAYNEGRRTLGRWELPLDLLRGLARLRLGRREWHEAGELLEEQIRRFPADAGTGARLELAQVHLVGRDRPRKALETLAPLTGATLTDAQRAQLAKLTAEAEAKVAGGALELDD